MMRFQMQAGLRKLSYVATSYKTMLFFLYIFDLVISFMGCRLERLERVSVYISTCK
jgi:hypothetical protein